MPMPEREQRLLPHYAKTMDSYSPLQYNTFIDTLQAYHGYDRLEDTTVLDVGCGVAPLLGYEHAPRQENYLGFDPSAQRIKVASSRYPQARFVVGPWQDIELTDKYDIVIAVEVLEHLEDPVGCWEQMVEWTAPGGTTIGCVPLKLPYLAHLQDYNGVLEVMETFDVDNAGVWYQNPKGEGHQHAVFSLTKWAV